MDHADSSSVPEPLRRLRRSLADVLARAVLELRPDTKLGLGAVTGDGFYYDFVFAEPLTPADFPGIEQRMREILALGAELADIAADGFALRAIDGAYFEGDAANIMMTRLRAWAFASAADLAEHAAAVERALQRDHKKLGRELALFAFDDEIGPGLPLWLPHGAAIRRELEKLMEALEFDAGFERVATPHLARVELYQRTGHLPYYADGMFPFMHQPGTAENAVFALKPMNCPHHHKIFAAQKRSYRELPFRISEYGHVFRYEDSGAVSGLLRTRCMCMNDAHIYCSLDQVPAELRAVLDMHRVVYDLLGLCQYRIRLSTRGPAVSKAGAREKFVDDPAGWVQAEALLRAVLVESGMPFFEGPGEAAFYGPKIDFQFRTVTGREETASTLQLDFAMADRLGLEYVAADGKAHRPWIIHRAPLGTHERFVALLIERFGGAFPTWLAPVQVRVIPVSDAQLDYAREVQRALRAERVRAELDPADESLAKRIRAAVAQKIPNVLVVGERERAERTVSLRRYGRSARQEVVGLDAFRAALVASIATRALDC